MELLDVCLASRSHALDLTRLMVFTRGSRLWPNTTRRMGLGLSYCDSVLNRALAFWINEIDIGFEQRNQDRRFMAQCL
jgi:hypothetical protein